MDTCPMAIVPTTKKNSLKIKKKFKKAQPKKNSKREKQAKKVITFSCQRSAARHNIITYTNFPKKQTNRETIGRRLQPEDKTAKKKKIESKRRDGLV
jgi:hypothetical protein